MGRLDSFAPQQGRSDSVYTWTNVKEKVFKPPQADGILFFYLNCLFS